MPASRAPTLLERSKYVIYWRGEAKSGYTATFRHWEFVGALTSVMSARYAGTGAGAAEIENAAKAASFTNLFTLNPANPASADQVDMYNTALQVLVFGEGEGGVNVTDEDVFKATSRCSLIHHTYLWLGEGATYADLVRDSINSKVLRKAASNGETWRVRRYEFSFLNDTDNPRFGKDATRSVAKERKSLPKIWPVLELFKGAVDLKDPVIHLNLLEGLHECGPHPSKPEELKKVLALTLACGAKHMTISPRTRICKTTTPLCSISSHLLCNVAMVGSGPSQSILDPFAGSAATLLAAAMISPEVRTVGIDTGFGLDISRADIHRDFTTRGLAEPVLIQGDVLDSASRDDARSANCGAFDVIMTDPPYLIRESFTGEQGMGAPLLGLLKAMGEDFEQGKPLLKRGGSLVSFVPCTPGHHIDELLPKQHLQDFAGLQLQTKREQKINSSLSRWIVAFRAVR